MKSVFGILLAAVTFTSILASAEVNKFTTLKNTSHAGVKAAVLSVTDEGVPLMIGFSKERKVIAFTSVTPNNDPIDVSVGEVYDIKSPDSEGDVCSLSGKLIPTATGFKIDLSDAGTAFRSCPEALIEGTYSK